MGKEKARDPLQNDDSEESREGNDPRRGRSESGEDPSGRAAIPDLIRRAMAVGFSSFFTTEEAIRKALGDTLPQDWVEFASAQSERTRAEFIDRLALEFGRVVEKVDLHEMAEKLLEGRTVEVTAQIRLGSRSRPAAEEKKPPEHDTPDAEPKDKSKP